MNRRIVLNLYCFPVYTTIGTFDDHHDVDQQCHTRRKNYAQTQDEYPIVVGLITLLLTLMFDLVVVELLASDAVGSTFLVLHEVIRVRHYKQGFITIS